MGPFTSWMEFATRLIKMQQAHTDLVVRKDKIIKNASLGRFSWLLLQPVWWTKLDEGFCLWSVTISVSFWCIVILVRSDRLEAILKLGCITSEIGRKAVCVRILTKLYLFIWQTSSLYRYLSLAKQITDVLSKVDAEKYTIYPQWWICISLHVTPKQNHYWNSSLVLRWAQVSAGGMCLTSFLVGFSFYLRVSSLSFLRNASSC